MFLKLYNSKSNTKELFSAIDPSCVRFYVCGPTVYNEIHVGNARSAIVFDLLFRVLKLLYPAVIYVRNITDIDDKIIQKAAIEKTSPEVVASFWTDSYFRNCKLLNLLEPTFSPKATETIPEIIQFIETLILREFAYLSGADVFFDVAKLPEYGSLSKNDSLLQAHRIASNSNKLHQHDFVLWKSAKEGEPAWESPWGLGRPGWHIECSAMSFKFLGSHFDIHAGGADLLFPHHENEQAQNFACHGSGSGPQFWIHNAMLAFNSEKMSKSLGNVLLLSDLFKKYHPVFLKFYLLSAHYRHVLHWNEDNIKVAAVKFSHWIMHLAPYFNLDESFDEKYLGELLNDLNTPGFFVAFEQSFNAALASNDLKILQQLAALLKFLGLDCDVPLVSSQVLSLAEKRREKKLLRDFVAADLIRDEISSLGFAIFDTKDGFEIKAKFSAILA